MFSTRFYMINGCVSATPPEIPDKYKYPQSFWKVMCSGETVIIHRKSGNAVIHHWKTPQLTSKI